MLKPIPSDNCDPIPESTIKAQILTWLKLNKIYAWSQYNGAIYDPKRGVFRAMSQHSKRGVSDILGILPGGRLLAIEVKSKTGRLSRWQVLFLDDVRRNGGVAFMARSVDDVILGLRIQEL